MSTTVTSRGQRPASKTLPNRNQKINQKNPFSRWVSSPLGGRLLPTDNVLSTDMMTQGKQEIGDTF